MFFILVIIILVASLLTVGLVVIRKFPQLVSIDTNQIPKEKLKQVKSQIIEQRVNRKIQGHANILINLILPIFKRTLNGLSDLYHKIIKLEKYYKERSQKIKFIKDQNTESVINTTEDKLKKAREWLNQDNFFEAENIFIEIISYDPKNIPAYVGLAEVYLKQQDYEHSNETYEHIIKIDPDNFQGYSGLAKVALERDRLEEAQKGFEKAIQLPGATLENYINLGKVYEKTLQNDKALSVYNLASRIEPNNPKILDLLLGACILNKNRILAKGALNKLKKANPANQKLDEFKKRIDEI